VSVYLITDGEYYKIGYTDLQVERRIAELQTGNPRKLSVIAVLNGGRQLEQQFHAMFGHGRVGGEWFKLDQTDLAKFICWECKHCGAGLAHAPMDPSAIDVGVRKTLEWIKASEVKSFTARELHRALWRNDRIDVVKAVLLVLVERGHVHAAVGLAPKSGKGRPTEKYEVHPEVFKGI